MIDQPCLMFVSASRTATPKALRGVFTRNARMPEAAPDPAQRLLTIVSLHGSLSTAQRIAQQVRARRESR